MKLVMVTAVQEFQKDVLGLFKKAQIESFSSSDIDGYKNASSILKVSNWFSSIKGGTESCLFFSFTDEDSIDLLFSLIKDYNKNLETNNPMRAIVLPIEKHI